MKQSIQTINVSRPRLFLCGAILGLLASPVATAQTLYDPVYGAVVSTETSAGAPLSIARDAFGGQAIAFNTDQISLRYDPDRRRALKLTDDNTDTAYLYAQSGLSPRVAVDRTNDKLTYYIPGLQNIDSDAATRQTVINSYNGSTRALVDPHDIILGRYAYDTIGSADRIVDCAPSQAGCNTVSSFPFLYQGHEHDTETGLHNFVARMYSSDTGRFLHLDSAGQAIAYEAMLNTWPNAVDPDGNLSWLILDNDHATTRSFVTLRRKIQSELSKYAARHNGTYPDFEIYLEDQFLAFQENDPKFQIQDSRFEHYIKMDRFLKMKRTRYRRNSSGHTSQEIVRRGDTLQRRKRLHSLKISFLESVASNIMEEPASSINLNKLTYNDLNNRILSDLYSGSGNIRRTASRQDRMLTEYLVDFQLVSGRTWTRADKKRPINMLVEHHRRGIQNIKFAKTYAENITMFRSDDHSKGIKLMTNDLIRHANSPDIYRFGIIGDWHYYGKIKRMTYLRDLWFAPSDLNLRERFKNTNVNVLGRNKKLEPLSAEE